MQKLNFTGKRTVTVVLLTTLICLLTTSLTIAQEQSAEYLKYQEPQHASSSALSTFGYILSLLFTFGLVIGLAYFTSRFLGYKFGGQINAGSSRIITTLALGPNRALYVVEIAGKVLVLGVTDHTIQMLQEITNIDEIKNLRTQSMDLPSQNFHQVFQQQFSSLQKMSQKFPLVFGSDEQSIENKNEHGKR